MASGLDVDTMVKQLMSAEKVKVDKLTQNRQIVQWRQEMFRDLIGELNTFKSTYFDVLKPDNYMLSNRNYSSYDLVNLSTSPNLSANVIGTAVPGNYAVTVSQLAEKAIISPSDYSGINVERAVGKLNLASKIDGTNKEIKFTIDSETYTVQLDENNYYLSDLVNQINSKLVKTKNSLGGEIDGSKLAKAVLSADGKSVRMVAVKSIDNSNNKFSVDIAGAGPVELTIEEGKYSMDELAIKINSKLTEKGFNTKVKAEVSSDNNNIHFSKPSSVTDVVTINGTEIPNDNSITAADDIFSVNMNTSDPASNNVLSYSRQIIDDFNDKLNIKIGTTSVLVDLSGKTYSATDTDKDVLTDIASQVTTQITSSTGSNELQAKVSLEGDKIEFISHSNKTVNISGSLNKAIGFSSNFDVSTSVDDKITTLLNDLKPTSSENMKVTFVINDGVKDVTFRYDFGADTDVTTGTDPNKITTIGAKNKSINEIMSDISSKINGKLSYSQLTRKFTLESNDTGLSQSLSVTAPTTESSEIIDSTNNFLTALFGRTTGLSDTGLDANVNIVAPGTSAQGVDVVKSTNNFTIDGISYTLTKADTPPTVNNITVTANPQKSLDKIKSFVNKYNELIDKINTKLTEKKQYDYVPLTDDQKKDMKEEEINKWEEKAKQGLLANDSNLGNMLYAMRSAFYEPVKNNYADSGSIGITMADIGITTSSDISQRGKLVIDENKLKDAIQNKGDKIMELFAKSSTTVPTYNMNGTVAERQQRYKESGIFQRINDILQDNLRTIRNSNGKKGILLEKAGIKGDYTEYHNILTDDIYRRDKIIKEMTTRLADKENKYYIQFSKLESAMEKLNSQSSWLSSQLSGMSG